jgi:hypothetical protein
MLLEDWPVDDDLVIDLETLPPALLESMGEAWRDREAYHEYITNQDESGRSAAGA